MTESPKVPGPRTPVDPNTLPLCPRGCPEGVSVSQEGGLDEPVWVHCDNLECSWNAALEDWNCRAAAPVEDSHSALAKEMRTAFDTDSGSEDAPYAIAVWAFAARVEQLGAQRAAREAEITKVRAALIELADVIVDKEAPNTVRAALKREAARLEGASQATLPSQRDCAHEKWIGPYRDDGPGEWLECENCGKLRRICE